MNKADRFKACILGGAIGDAWGSAFENQLIPDDDVFYLGEKPEVKERSWNFTDDTQLTLATMEALIEDKSVNPEIFAKHFVRYYKQRKLNGLGSSTLKALQELAFGGHWSQVGRRGEYAAGNGAAMRIAPLAFLTDLSHSKIRDICSITHHNDEAYIGARSVIIAIQEILNGNWNGEKNLIEMIIDQLPDTKVRDRFIEIKDLTSIQEIGKLGNQGYVVDSVPLAIAAANQVDKIGLHEMFNQLIDIGGDTDTNCSIAGQVAGTLIGIEKFPENLLNKLKILPEYQAVESGIEKFTLIIS